MSSKEEEKQAKHAMDMDPAEIGIWVGGTLGMPEYIDAFVHNHVDGKCLRTLDRDDLTDLGIKSVGHRVKILQAIASIKQVAAIAHRNRILLEFREHCKLARALADSECDPSSSCRPSTVFDQDDHDRAAR